MSDDTDHDDGAADRRQIQMFITAVAGYVGEKARERQEQAQRATAESGEKQRVVQAQLAAERASAQAVWQPTLQPDWWTQASVEDVQRAYQAAAEWAPFDENAARAADAIAQRVGVDVVKVDQAAPTAGPVESAETIEQTRNLAPEEAADVHNAEWDSSERRAASSEQAALGYRAAGLAEDITVQAVEAERITDLGQAMPAQASVAAGAQHRASKGAGVTAGRTQMAQRTVHRTR